MPDVIYHLALKKDLEKGKACGSYTCDSLDKEGFIHFSFRDQVEASGRKHCAGIKDLYLIEVKTEGLTQLKVENGFPHLYSSLPIDNILKTEPISF